MVLVTLHPNFVNKWQFGDDTITISSCDCQSEKFESCQVISYSIN